MCRSSVERLKAMRGAVLLSSLFVLTALLPLVQTVQAAETEDVRVCCDASEVELYLLGNDANKKLTPFASELAEEAQSLSLDRFPPKKASGAGFSRTLGVASSPRPPGSFR